MSFNNGVQSFPWLLLARPFGFREREFFSATGDTRRARSLLRPVRDASMTLQQQIRSNRFRSLIAIAGFVPAAPGHRRARSASCFDVSFGIFALVFAAVYGIFALVQFALDRGAG